jgi:hypothetical protein
MDLRQNPPQSESSRSLQLSHSYVIPHVVSIFCFNRSSCADNERMAQSNKLSNAQQKMPH